LLGNFELQFFLSSALLCFAFSGKERRKTISRIMDDGVAFKQTEYESWITSSKFPKKNCQPS
jgi:hypothetical protein